MLSIMVLNANFELICVTCHECMFDAIHDLCVRDYLNDVNARVKSKSVKSTVPPRKSISTTVVKQIQPSRNKSGKLKDLTNVGSSSKSKTVVQMVLWYPDSGCSKHMTGQRSQLGNFVSKFLESDSTAFYTQNRSFIRLRYNKTPYELMHDKKLDLSFLHVFGWLCYPTNDSEDLGNMKVKADIGIFVGNVLAKKAYRTYNKHTRMIMETIHVTFDELTAMASEQFSSGPAPQLMTPGTLSSRLYLNPPSSVVSPVQEATAARPVDPADSSSSTSIDKDAPSTSYTSLSQAYELISNIIFN
ncbi:retrovirus-related pol polyprotein from transposon TNT 1-94 [Tanacetum coccineum]